MTTPWHAALLLLVVGVACGRPVDAAQQPAGRATTTTETPSKAAKPRAVPLALETGVPARPPKVALVAERGDRQIVQAGVEFTHDWTIGGVADQVAKDYPVPWPQLLEIGRDDEVVLTFDTTIVPDWVVVRSYTNVLEPDRIPEAVPISARGCVRLSEPRCRYEPTDHGLRITGLDRSMLDGSYIVVFGMWHVPLAMQQAKTAPSYEVAASWLFRITTTPQPQDSQS